MAISTALRRMNEALPAPPLSADQLRRFLRHLGITEELFVHQQDVRQFMEEKGITELGRGGEGAVYFLRGHVVKVVNPEGAYAAQREVAHMLHLNRLLRGGTMGERARQDWPSLLWIYLLSDGSLSIGMKPFDRDDSDTQGSTLYDRLNFGPTLERIHLLRSLRAIAHSLLYCERQGIIHHDLKPANIYIPGQSTQPPVVFDLGQALWKQNAWGRMWLRNEHNLHYWYNGTYRYMNRIRRQAHWGAMNTALQVPLSTQQTQALANYVPTFYDDVFAFARILRDCVKSTHTTLQASDKTALRLLYQKFMGVDKSHPRPESHLSKNPSESGILRRISLMFQAPPAEPAPQPTAEQRWGSMEQVVPELEKTLETQAPLSTFEFPQPAK